MPITGENTTNRQDWILNPLEELFPAAPNSTRKMLKGGCWGFSIGAAQALVTNEFKSFFATTSFLMARQGASLATIKDTHLLDDIANLCLNMDRIQNPGDYADKLPPGKSKEQLALSALPLIETQAAKKAGGLTYLTPFTGMFDTGDLLINLSRLKSLVDAQESMPHRFTMVVRSSGHAVTLSYHLNAWTLININKSRNESTHVAIQFCGNNFAKVSLALMKVLGKRKLGALSTYVFATHHSSAIIQGIVNDWRNSSLNAYLKVTKAKATIKDDHGVSWLLMATMQGETDVVIELLQNGAKQLINDKCARLGYSPLSIACALGRTSLVRALLTAGADAETTLTHDGLTPLMVAALNGHDQVAGVLLKHGVNPNTPRHNDGHETALHLATDMGHSNVVMRLLSSQLTDLSATCTETREGTTIQLTPLDIANQKLAMSLSSEAASCARKIRNQIMFFQQAKALTGQKRKYNCVSQQFFYSPERAALSATPANTNSLAMKV